MLKYIQFILSEYYYGIMADELEEIQDEVKPHGVSITMKQMTKVRENLKAVTEQASGDTLFITDEEEMLNQLLYAGAYAIALYHDHNRNCTFSATLYAVENVKQLEFRTYDEVYRRLAELPWDILETPRLLVRESTIADVEEFYKIYQHPSVLLYVENLFLEHDEERAYMKDYIKQIYGFYGYGLWTVVLKETGQIIGRAGLSVRSGYGLPELGFVIAAQVQRKGYAFEVCRAILDYAKNELQFDQVQAFTDVTNIASQSLLKKLGFSFKEEVTDGDHIYLRFHLTT